MNRLSLVPVLLGLLAASAPLPARIPIPLPKRPGQNFVNRAGDRQNRQQGRIIQGVQTGRLTRRETAHLEHQQVRIERSVVRAEADGHVTVDEAARIDSRQDAASRRIYRKKHNGRMTP